MSHTSPATGAPCLLLFTKPAHAGRVKTRLIGLLSPEQCAELHSAFLGDLWERLAEASSSGPQGLELRLVWALADGEEPPPSTTPTFRQRGGDLGERLFAALSEAAIDHPVVAAVGSDLPDLPVERVREAFAALAAGRDVALGPATDGGYYLIALRRESLHPRLFDGITWSTGDVLRETLARCVELSLDVALLPEASDVDTPVDLARLARALLEPATPACPRTAALLERWGMVGSATAVAP